MRRGNREKCLGWGGITIVVDEKEEEEEVQREKKKGRQSSNELNNKDHSLAHSLIQSPPQNIRSDRERGR